MKYRAESFCVIDNETNESIARCDSALDTAMLASALNGQFFTEFEESIEIEKVIANRPLIRTNTWKKSE